MAEEFPDDPNGDVLRSLRGSGDSLTSPRDVYFSVIFPDAEAATAFCRQLREIGYEAKLEETSGSDKYPNDVTVTVNMVPTHADIGGFVEHNLVSNQLGVADHFDPNLVNPWGISSSAASPFWATGVLQPNGCPLPSR